MAIVHPNGSALAATIEARPLKDLRRVVQNDPNELLAHRYLSRGGGLLLVGPTGIGKSSFSMQAMLSWAVELPLFGITPRRPLRSLLIQAENDEGDLAEMRDGVMAGLDLAAADAEEAGSSIYVYQETGLTGLEFIHTRVRPLVVAHQPDLVWIDPALAFIGGEAISQADVGSFLRNGLHPLLREFSCGAVIVHHTNKPSGKNKKKPSPLDLAYSGAGSAEWANWCRAVLVIEPTGLADIFNLHAAKRGIRLRWEDQDGRRILQKTIAHSKSPDQIFWRPATEEEGRSIHQPLASAKARSALDLLPPTGAIEKKRFEELIRTQLSLGEKAARAAISKLIAEGVAFKWRVQRQGGGPHESHLSRSPQAEDQVPKSRRKQRKPSLSAAGILVPTTTNTQTNDD